jgi:hypothetical protein
MTTVSTTNHTPLKKDITQLKSDLFDLEKRFNSYAVEIEIREQRWKNCEKKLEDLNKINEGQCTLNIGGKKFEVSLYTLKSRRGTIFYKQILRGEIKKGTTTFYDRDSTYFPIILSFLRTGKFKADKLSDEQKDDLLNEAQFYEVNFIIETLKATPQEIEFTAIDTSGIFQYEGQNVGSTNPKDLKDKFLNKGVCVTSPSTLTISFNREAEFDSIDLGGYNGNSISWYVGNGRGANIYTSMDKNNWTSVGQIPNDFGATIQNVKVNKTKARHIKFSHNDYLGIGYLEIKEFKKGK